MHGHARYAERRLQLVFRGQPRAVSPFAAFYAFKNVALDAFIERDGGTGLVAGIMN